MMKRKDLDNASQDFSDFSPSSPATKIRRITLDGEELHPLMEEEAAEAPTCFGSPMRRPNGVVIEEIDDVSFPENEERAIVLFNPSSNPLLQKQPHMSPYYSVDPDIISNFKDRFPWLNSTDEKLYEDEKAVESEKSSRCMAVVPWVPSQLSSSQVAEVSDGGGAEIMEAEETGDGSMEIEVDNANGSVQVQSNPWSGHLGSEGFQQWQQHCMTPELPQSTSSPVVWYR